MRNVVECALLLWLQTTESPASFDLLTNPMMS
jgi:hypothetical protein